MKQPAPAATTMAPRISTTLSRPTGANLLLALQFADDPIAVKTLHEKKTYWDEHAFKNGPCKSRPDCVLTQPVTIDPQGVAHVIRDIQMVRK